jgi:hypothetical protein
VSSRRRPGKRTDRHIDINRREIDANKIPPHDARRRGTRDHQRVASDKGPRLVEAPAPNHIARGHPQQPTVLERTAQEDRMFPY